MGATRSPISESQEVFLSPQAEERIATIVAEGVRNALATSEDHQALRTLQGLVTTLCEEQRAVAARLGTVEKRLEEVADDLQGDNGIINAVRCMQPCINTLEKAVMGDRDHPEENKGLVVRVTKLEELKQSLSRPVWIILTTVLTTATGIFLTNFFISRAQP